MEKILSCLPKCVRARWKGAINCSTRLRFSTLPDLGVQLNLYLAAANAWALKLKLKSNQQHRSSADGWFIWNATTLCVHHSGFSFVNKRVSLALECIDVCTRNSSSWRQWGRIANIVLCGLSNYENSSRIPKYLRTWERFPGRVCLSIWSWIITEHQHFPVSKFNWNVVCWKEALDIWNTKSLSKSKDWNSLIKLTMHQWRAIKPCIKDTKYYFLLQCLYIATITLFDAGKKECCGTFLSIHYSWHALNSFLLIVVRCTTFSRSIVCASWSFLSVLLSN